MAEGPNQLELENIAGVIADVVSKALVKHDCSQNR
jgi:hypothetical protein